MVKRCSHVGCSISLKDPISSSKWPTRCTYTEFKEYHSIQILHVNGNHWIAVHYDMWHRHCCILYSSLSKSTQQLLAKLILTDSKQVTVSMCAKSTNKLEKMIVHCLQLCIAQALHMDWTHVPMFTTSNK